MVRTVPDAIFAHPRLAALYDEFDGPRHDLATYVEMVAEFGARSVLDIGCGTGVLARQLAVAGLDVVGVDPAAASLDVARGGVGGELVRWLHGDASSLPPLQVDMAVMTGNVAQVFLTDDDWLATLAGAWGSLQPSGRLVFEVRDPAMRAWEEWTPALTRVAREVPGEGRVESWTEVTSVALPLVSFRHTYRFADGTELMSESTLRFRSHEEILAALASAGFVADEVRDAPDRPGKEWVFVASVAAG